LRSLSSFRLRAKLHPIWTLPPVRRPVHPPSSP
jgi:hypothetical protein